MVGKKEQKKTIKDRSMKHQTKKADPTYTKAKENAILANSLLQ